VAQVICRYRKGEQVRWISHLDLSHLDLKRTLERAMRRAQLPLLFSQGHNPHPKLSLGPPLPLGATGDAELLAIHLTEALDPDEVKERLNKQLPPSLEIVEVWQLPRYKKKETFGEIDVAQYRVTVQGEADLGEVGGRVEALLAREELIVHRGGERPERTVDVRPFILSLAAAGAKERGVELDMRLRTGSHGGVRPQEVVGLLGLDGDDRRIIYHRIGLYAGAQAAVAPRKGALRRWTRSRGPTQGREQQ
jgi:radical SAM-linked protein